MGAPIRLNEGCIADVGGAKGNAAHIGRGALQRSPAGGDGGQGPPNTEPCQQYAPRRAAPCTPRSTA